MYGLNKTAVHSICFDPQDAHYVLQLCGHHELELLAASSTNCSIKVYDRPRLNFVQSLPGHTARINDLTSSSSQGIFLSAADDGKVFGWDPRSDKPAHTVRLQGEAMSVTTGGGTETLVAVACAEQVRIWDLRNTSNLLGVLEPHSEDVSTVRFHPTQRQMLLSGSMDGLLCVHDTSLGLDEDEATVAVLNVEQPVASIGFHGDSSELLHCFTTVEGMALFDMTSFERIAAVPDVRPALSDTFQAPIDYLISAHWAQQKLYLAAGDQKCCAQAPAVVANLPGGHTEPVRTLYWDKQLSYLVSGGEDSRLCWWGDASVAAEPVREYNNSSHLKMRTEKEDRKAKPY